MTQKKPRFLVDAETGQCLPFRDATLSLENELTPLLPLLEEFLHYPALAGEPPLNNAAYQLRNTLANFLRQAETIRKS